MTEFTPYRNAVTGLRHHVMPLVKSACVPKALLFVGNSLFFFNNGAHRMLRQLLAKTPGAPKFRTNMVAINGASLSWHDVESYFRPNAISSYSINENNEVIFRDPAEQLWDSLILLDSTQGPIHPVLGPQFRAAATLVDRVKRAENVELVLDSTVATLIGEDRLTGVTVENKFTKEQRTLEVNGLFVAVGILPRNELVAGQIELDEGGFIVTDKNMQTNIPGVFAAGDIRNTPLRQVVTACADGAIAATKAVEYVGMK